MIKPGYKTSEFWFTFVSFIFSGLYLLGVIGENSQKEELIRDVSHAVESTILISGQLYILYKYIKGRTEIKKISQETPVVIVEQTAQPAQTNPKPKKVSKSKASPGRPKNDNKRTSTKSRRKNN